MAVFRLLCGRPNKSYYGSCWSVCPVCLSRTSF